MRLIDATKLRETMYREAFETDSDMQKWDSGCWIRYKMFEKNLDNAPTVDAVPVRHGKWIEKRTYSGERPIGEWQSCKCSVCNRYDNRPYLYYFSKPEFCSWCGSRMDGEEYETALKEKTT